jgi:hypothetical protein
LQLPYLQAGKMRALAVTGIERLAALPQVPTMAEAGFEQAQYHGGQDLESRPVRRRRSSSAWLARSPRSSTVLRGATF